MKAQIIIRTLIYSKMKAISFVALLFFAMLPFVGSAASVSFGVTFGNPQSNGGDCVGKGVCRESFDISAATGTYGASPEAVSVTFLVNATNPGVLLMRFSMSELMRKQPGQVALFTDSRGYSFDGKYSLLRPAFEPLKLLPGAAVQSNLYYTVQIVDDLVTVYIPYSHL